jgi:hypothetical protein
MVNVYSALCYSFSRRAPSTLTNKAQLHRSLFIDRASDPGVNVLFPKKVQRFASLRLLINVLILTAACCVTSVSLGQSTKHQPVGVQIIVVPSSREAQQILDRLNAG